MKEYKGNKKKLGEIRDKIEIHMNIEHDNIFTLIDYHKKDNYYFIF